MEYQIIKFLDNTPNQPCKFKIKYWVEIHYGSQGTYHKDYQIRFKTSRSSLCNYSDAYTVVKGTMTVANTAAATANYVPFTNCISQINNTQADDVHDIDVVMPMYNLIKYSDNYLKTSGNLWQYCRDELAVDDNGVIADFTEGNAIRI